ncbi:MAG TPA: hypothetical protein ENN80_14620 [Candidatus Hydrogenedentes bacterium]|nr:hypothetical protein [Candidatus Hydrogenedentota bacterium]
MAVLVVVLGKRVWEVLNPQEPPPPPQYRYPDTQIEAVDYERIGFPGAPPFPPPPPPERIWRPLWEKNPFWYNPGLGAARENRTKDIGVSLLRIVVSPDGTARAQLRVTNSTGWYEEGQEFEAFELVSIDPTSDECVIFSYELGERITLKKKKR